MLELIREQSKYHQVWLACPEKSDLTELATDIGAEVVLPRRVYSSGIARYVNIVRMIRRHVRENSVDIVHSNLAPCSRYAVPAVWGTKAKTVTHQRDNYKRNRHHFGLGWSDHIVAISRHVATTLPESFQVKTSVIHNSVEVPQQVSEGSQDGIVRVGMAARGIPEKGVDILIDAASRLGQDLNFEIHIWGIGDATQFERQQIMRIAGFEPWLRSRFYVEPFRKDIETFYQTVDAVVVPSRFEEPFGRMAIEPMAWGVPVLVAGHGGLVEIVENDKNGLVFEPNVAQSLACQLERLIGNQQLRQELALAGRETVIQRFAPQLHFLAIDKVYRCVMSDGK